MEIRTFKNLVILQFWMVILWASMSPGFLIPSFILHGLKDRQNNIQKRFSSIQTEISAIVWPVWCNLMCQCFVRSAASSPIRSKPEAQRFCNYSDIYNPPVTYWGKEDFLSIILKKGEYRNCVELSAMKDKFNEFQLNHRTSTLTFLIRKTWKST